MTDKPARKWNPAWKDTTRAERQAKRLAALNKIAIAAGYESWRKLETAVIHGDYIVINAQNHTHINAD